MSMIFKTLASTNTSSRENNPENNNSSSNTHLELLINRMEDGFSKIFVQLEAMDERMQEVQGMGDKVDMLEASVRLLENNALGSWTSIMTTSEQPPPPMMMMDSPAQDMSLSSSSLHSVHTVTSVASATGSTTGSGISNNRNPPRRNHTIGNIKYDSARWGPSVSFNLECDNNNFEADPSEDEEINFEDESAAIARSGSSSGIQRKRTTSSGSTGKQNQQSHKMDSIDEAVLISTTKMTSSTNNNNNSTTSSSYVIPTIVRSKSFSNNLEYAKMTHSQKQEEDNVTPKLTSSQATAAASAVSPKTSPSRSRSLRLQQPPTGGNQNRSTRLSWSSYSSSTTNQDLPDHHQHQPSLKASSGGIADSKLRGSCTSLASVDLAATSAGSGATTPTPAASSIKGSAFEISARELMQRPSCYHSGNIEVKKTSGFKSYKRYWAVLDSSFLYLFGKEKDTKAKQVIDVTSSTILELSSSTSDNTSSSNSSYSNNPAGASSLGHHGGYHHGPGGSNSEKLSSGSFRESLKKRGGRSFEMVFNNGENRTFAAHTKDEADEWVKKLKEASAASAQRLFEEEHDHHERVAVELAYEEEVVHEVASSILGSEVQQEWRLAVKKEHSRNPSRYF